MIYASTPAVQPYPQLPSCSFTMQHADPFHTFISPNEQTLLNGVNGKPHPVSPSSVPAITSHSNSYLSSANFPSWTHAVPSGRDSQSSIPCAYPPSGFNVNSETLLATSNREANEQYHFLNDGTNMLLQANHHQINGNYPGGMGSMQQELAKMVCCIVSIHYILKYYQMFRSF